MSIEMLPATDRHYYVYAFMFQDDDVGPLYVKFGQTMNIAQRIMSIRSSCPIPLVSFGVMETKTKDAQMELEKALHSEFKSRNTSGEWFSFDTTSEDDKAAFHKGCARVFAYNLGPGFKWTIIDAGQYLKAMEQRKNAFIRKGGINSAIKKNKRMSAAREMAEYRGN